MSDPKASHRVASMGYLVVTLAMVAGLVYVLQPHDPDIAFCRRVFGGLANGRATVQADIDWEALQALDFNVGEAFAKLPTDQDRFRYKFSFVLGFAQGFRATGARPSSFVNWRVLQRSGGSATVAADYPQHSKTLLMDISTVGRRRLKAIHWQGAPTAKG